MNRKHPSQECGHKFTQKDDLFTHPKSLHSGENYQCEQWDYQATKQSNLTRHHQSAQIRVENIHASNVITRQHRNQI